MSCRVFKVVDQSIYHYYFLTCVFYWVQYFFFTIPEELANEPIWLIWNAEEMLGVEEDRFWINRRWKGRIVKANIPKIIFVKLILVRKLLKNPSPYS